MTVIDYGVIRLDGLWTIVGQNLRYGAFHRRSSAIRAARRLAENSGGLSVRLHLQDEFGERLTLEWVCPEA